MMLTSLYIINLVNIIFSNANDLYSNSVNKFDDVNFKYEIGLGNHFVMFYAPWCGHCKRLAPTWEELALKYNKNSEIKISKVDCTVETSLCTEQDVTGYPTLKLFKSGTQVGNKYHGARDIGALDQFISSSLGEAQEDSPLSPTIPKAQPTILELSDETFHPAVEKGAVFVKFYAPWCGHCQKLAPIWEELAESLKHDKSVSIAKVDCTVNRDICNEYEVKGYPTLQYLVDGKMIKKYTGPRTHEEFKAFLTEIKREDHTPEEPAISSVISLTENNFAQTVEKDVTFVKFYAPWCGHCKRLNPVWDQLSSKFLTHNDVSIAKVDCTVEDKLCRNYKVEGYPTLVLFRNGQMLAEYSESRDLESLHKFVLSRAKERHEEL